MKWGKAYVRISAGEGCSKMMDSFTIFGDIFEETIFWGMGFSMFFFDSLCLKMNLPVVYQILIIQPSFE